MKDIVDEAIYFDMYYFTKPPKPGEKVEVPAVTEETPQFRNFEISNVVCNGAGKGIFIRGLPEMSVKNISIRNSTLRANKAAEIIEAENISLDGLKIISAETNPVIYVESSRAIAINAFVYSDNAEVLLKVNGERSRDIRLINTNTNLVKHKVGFENGAGAKSVVLK